MKLGFWPSAGAIAASSVIALTPAQAQIWVAQDILNHTSARSINLQARKGSETVVVDTVSRSWIERAMSVSIRLAPAYDMSVPAVLVTYDKSPNAYVTFDKQRQPVMAINTAMLRMVGEDDNLLAAVIGHEFGHLKANHLTDGASKQKLTSLIGILAGLALDLSQAKRGIDTQGLGTQIGALGGDLVNAKFNRDQEREADELGIQAMARAGFNPQAVSTLWRQMAGRGSGGAGLWLDSHPSHAERERAMLTAAASLSPSTLMSPTASAQFAGIDLPEVRDPWPPSTYNGLALTPSDQSAEAPSNYRRGLEHHRANRFEEAVAAWQASIEVDNDERAMVYLSDAHVMGRGIPKNDVTAYELMQRAASKGLTIAIYMLGEMKSRGTGSAQDAEEAHRMFIIAHQRGWPRATARLGLNYMTGSNATPRDSAKARQLAQSAADRNDALGKSVLGAMVRDGLGGPADPSRGFQLLREGVDAWPGGSFGQFQLAIAYERGLGVTADKDAAIAAYRRAASAGVTVARDRLKALGAADSP